MRRSAVATPCPVPASLGHFLNNELDETTSTINFTTELRASFQNAKPRRRQRHPVHFAIHEDSSENASRDPPRTNLSHPPRRIQAVQKERNPVAEKRKSQILERDDMPGARLIQQGSVLGQAPRRPVARLSLAMDSTAKEPNMDPKPISAQSTRPARRGTLYIPNDDTTMPSMYMGIFSPIKDMNVESDAVSSPEEVMELTGIAAQMASKRRPRNSMISSAARRGILQTSLRPVQENTPAKDIHGQGDGKENVPPGYDNQEKEVRCTNLKAVGLPAKKRSMPDTHFSNAERISIHAPTASSLQKRESAKAISARQIQSKPIWNGGARLKQSSPIPVAHKLSKPASPPPASSVASKPPVPTRFVMPVIRSEPPPQTYAILQEDIEDPAIYEENWLSHQEIAITQLVNSLFSASRLDDDAKQHTLRSKLLKLYCSAPMKLMYKRLQASLLYGSLSIPKDTLDKGTRIQSDIGLRKRFTDLWLCSFDLVTLKSALEVVVGRECCSHNLRMSEGSSSSSKPSKSALRDFIEAFLIRNEDAKPESDIKSRVAWSYQRTLLRSLLLLKVLDLVKTERSLETTGCLFQHDSLWKDSISMVQALFQMLNPAAGDPMRALGHVDYHVSHVQHPVEEFEYQIDNLAVDLRDGARLTRLVELLLYPSASQALDRYSDGGTTSVLMPEGEKFEFEEGQDWPLSQHLKMPAQSRIVRLWNVQLALSALKNIKGMAAFVEGITSEDIVDGHREKTIKLLWALVGKWGLRGLINWHDLKWEVRRLESLTSSTHSDEFEDEFELTDYTFEACETLVKRWARIVALSRGIEIQNFTTSFADGKVFEAIIDEYEPHLTFGKEQSTKQSSLKDRLARLGCSSEFSAIFAEATQTHIFSRDFVLSALAFLCSRLLAPSQRSRAATIIQQAWRRHWSQIEEVRKVEKKRIAMACADFVTSKHQTLKYASLADVKGANKVDQPNKMSIEQVRSLLSPTGSDIWLTL